MDEVFELRESFEWRGLGIVPHSALRLARGYSPRSTPNGASASIRSPAADNPACECGAILRGVKKPHGLQTVRHALHAGNADGLLHGVVGRRLRGALDLWPVPRPQRARWKGRPHEHVRDPFAASSISRNGRVDLSHGSGGRAMAHLIADIFHDAFDNDWLRRGNDQAAFDVAGRPHGDDHRRLCGFAAVLSRRRYRLARRARHDQRCRHGRRAAAVSVRELHHRGGLSRSPI